MIPPGRSSPVQFLYRAASVPELARPGRFLRESTCADSGCSFQQEGQVMQPSKSRRTSDRLGSPGRRNREPARRACPRSRCRGYCRGGGSRCWRIAGFQGSRAPEFGDKAPDTGRLCIHPFAREGVRSRLAFSMHTHRVAVAAWRWRHPNAPTDGCMKRVAAENLCSFDGGSDCWAPNARKVGADSSRCAQDLSAAARGDS